MPRRILRQSVSTTDRYNYFRLQDNTLAKSERVEIADGFFKSIITKLLAEVTIRKEIEKSHGCEFDRIEN